MKISRIAVVALLASSSLSAQQYVIATIAGGAPPMTPASALSASIGTPNTVALDSAGNVYFTSLNCVFKLDTKGIITRIAGNSRPGYSGDGGPAVDAQLNIPWGIVLDAAGNVYIADSNNSRVRKISPDGIITTVAGNGTRGYSGDDGPAASAQLEWPGGVAVDAAGNLYIGEEHHIRRVSPDGKITTSASTGALSLAVNGAGNLYFSTNNEYYNPAVFSVSPVGSPILVAGNTNDDAGFSGDGGPATRALLNWTGGLAADGAGNLYLADTYNGRIRKVSPDGLVNTVAGNGQFNFPGDGGPATAVSLSPAGLAVDTAGNVYVADPSNARIRKVSREGMISTVAGTGTVGFSGDGGLAIGAKLSWPADVALDGAGNLYIADTGNCRVRKVTPEGIITTVVGNGACEHVDGVPALQAGLVPRRVVTDSFGNLFITEDFSIRRMWPDGIVSTVVDNRYDCPVVSPTAFCAGWYSITGLALDGAGNIYFSDTTCRVRKVAPDVARTVTPGKVTDTLVGNGTCGHVDGIPAADTQLAFPASLVLDNVGNLLIGDGASVRKLTPGGVLSTIAGTGVAGYSGDGGPATDAQLSRAAGLAVDATGNIYVSGANAVRRLQPAGR